MNLNPVAAALDSISLGSVITAENLTMIPLLRARSGSDPASHGARSGSDPESARRRISGSALDSHGARSGSDLDSQDARESGSDPDRTLNYVVLDTALASGGVEITELSEGGSVPELLVVNRGPAPVLIIDGEELVGAKQNRVVNLTILVGAQSKLTIPVSCVEAGRWRSRSRAFAAAPRTQYASGRGKRMAQVSLSMRDRGVHASDQSEVWADIAAMSCRLRTSSPTGAMEALFDQHAGFIDRCVEACRPVDGQIGALFSIDGRVVGLDLFDRESTLRMLLPKLVRSVAVDALDSLESADTFSAESPRPAARRDRRGAAETAVPAAQQFLAVTTAAPQHVSPGVGLGEDVRLTTHAIAGAALVADGLVIHLSAFAIG